MEPLFGYDLVNGELVENHIEADFVPEKWYNENTEKPQQNHRQRHNNRRNLKW